MIVQGSSARVLIALVALFGLLLGRAGAAPACSTARIALVIGNAAYADDDKPLGEPLGNARALAASLQGLGFATTEAENLGQDAMLAAFADFERKVSPGATAAVVFSGYGMQTGGHTYLIPIDAKIWTEPDIKTFGFNLDRLVADLGSRGATTRIVVVDAARRNPYERRFRLSGSSGLAPVSGSPGLATLYSDLPGDVFGEADGATSAFANALVAEWARSGSTVEDSFRRTRSTVAQGSGAGQTPWVSSFLDEDVPLGGRNCPTVSQAAPPAAAPAPAQAMTATPPPLVPTPAVTADDDVTLTSPADLQEVRDRLYEQDFEPGAPGAASTSQAIQAYEVKIGRPPTGRPTLRLLQSLRAAPSLKPWGAITFAQGSRKWGMAWSADSRRRALADAQARCGAEDCTAAVTIFGPRCAAFALSSASWSITWRTDVALARQGSLAECGARGPACRIIGAVCADGSGRTP